MNFYDPQVRHWLALIISLVTISTIVVAIARHRARQRDDRQKRRRF